MIKQWPNRRCPNCGAWGLLEQMEQDTYGHSVDYRFVFNCPNCYLHFGFHELLYEEDLHRINEDPVYLTKILKIALTVARGG